MKIIIRVDASLRIGIGHIMRCLTLAKALVEKGEEVDFICRDHVGNLIEKVRQEGFIVHVLTTRTDNQLVLKKGCHLFHAEWLGVMQEQDAQECKPILEMVKPDWLIVDHYAIDQTWQSVLKPYYMKLMVIDDLGDRKHNCDLLLDQNYGSTDEKYQNLVPKHCKLLTGVKFSLLRQEFAQWRNYSLKRRNQKYEVNKILITLGGVDPDNYTGKILSQLANIKLNKNIELVVVMGETAPHLVAVVKQADAMPVKTTIKTNVTNMAELMANSDLAIGAAGATTWERCCLGLPTIQLVIAENQRCAANALAKDGIIVLVKSFNEFKAILQTIVPELESLKIRSSQLTDGNGTNSVLELLAL